MIRPVRRGAGGTELALKVRLSSAAAWSREKDVSLGRKNHGRVRELTFQGPGRLKFVEAVQLPGVEAH